MACPSGSDRSFGPQVDPSCREFDFTLQFEDIFFACIPSALFLVLGPIQILSLFRHHASYAVRSRALRTWKSIILTALLASQVMFLIARTQDQQVQTDASLAADILSCVATGVAFVLSNTSHKRSLRPSTVLILYLSLLLLLDVARIRTLWPLAYAGLAAIIMTLTMILTALALLLESMAEKRGLSLGSPEEYSNIWTRICFTWIISTLRMGYAKIISFDDLPGLDTKLESRVLRRQLISTWSKYGRHAWHGLLRACFHSYLTSFLSAIIPRLCVTAFTFAQPFLINTTIEFVSKKHPNANYGKGLVAAWALVYLGIAVSHSIYRHQTSRFVARLRGGLIAIVYQRCLDIREVDAGDITAVALMGTDIEHIASGMQMIHETWGSLLDIGIACWLLERQLFLACLAPIALVLVFVGATSRVSVAAQCAQQRWIEKAQERLRITASLLGDIKAIKMLGLSQTVSTILTRLRMDEIKTSKKFRELLTVTLMLSLTPINLAPVVTIAIYIVISIYWIKGSLLTAQAFTSIALITLLTTSVIVFIQSIPMLAKCISSFNRIQEYCNYTTADLKDDNYYEPGTVELHAESEIHLLEPEADSEGSQSPQPLAISVHHQSFGWDKTGPAFFKNIQVEIKRGSITAIVGPSGSGKSAFLNCILGEMLSIPATEGQSTGVERESKLVAYCSQQPWLENGTIRQNIIGISPFESDWYGTVVSSCGLDVDLKRLPRGDQTRIGSKGLNLNSGQKQRVALARAVYAKKRIAVLDDIFGDMEAHTANAISNRLLTREGLFRKHQTTVVFATHNRKIMALADTIIVLEGGKIVANDIPSNLLQSNGYIGKLGLQLPSDEDIEEAHEASHALTTQEAFQFAADIAEETGRQHTDPGRKKGERSAYAYYLTNSGWASVVLYTLWAVSWIFSVEFSLVWVKWWSGTNDAQPNKNVWVYLGVYALLGVLGTLSAWLCAWTAFISMISRSAAQLHSTLLQATLRAPLSYFVAMDIEGLLKRFSRDMELIDMELPSNLVNYTSTFVSFFAKIIILVIFTRYLGVLTPVFILVLYFLQKFYLRTSQQVRLLVVEAQAPLYTHFGESITGAASIRAFGWQSYHQERNYRLIDASQRPVYFQSCIQHWLRFVLELMVAAFVVLFAGTILIWRDRFGPGSVGVSLVTLVGLSEVLVRLIETLSKLEFTIEAVARIQKFATKTKSEGREDKGAYVPADWPQDGAIEFSGLVASYRTTPNSKPVLNGISMSVEAGQHVALCGRTGSGKGSLILSLLQMIDTVEGRIAIDGIDLSTLACAEVRSRINAVPKDPFLIPGTLRFNIDPYMAASDDEIIRALERTKLWSIIKDQGGLDKEIDSAAWSADQKQLLCFARAMVRKCKILVLDETTSSVSSETEALMQDIIDNEFRNHTVLAVVRHLKYIRSYDRAALFSDGMLLKYGEPGKLVS